MENGELKELTLYPIAMGYGKPRHQRGWPELTDDVGVLEQLQQLSAPFGTNIEIVGNLGKVNLEK